MPTNIVSCKEIFRGRSRQADLSGVPTYVRIFLVQVDSVNPNLRIVAAAPGIAWRDQHPDDVNSYLVESNTQQESDSPFFYRLTYTYKYLDESDLIPWERAPQYTFNGSLASAPAFWHYPIDNNNTTTEIIVNTAGDPLQGLDRDEGEFTVTIQKNVPPPFNYEMAQKYVGAINSDTWSNGLPKTWKCQSITSARKHEVVPAVTPDSPPQKVYYWDTTVTLAFKGTGWDLLTWDVGFNEIVGGKRVKIYAGSDPVSEPVALNNGQAKPAGQPPNELRFRIYPSLPFTGMFPPLPNTPPSLGGGLTYPDWFGMKRLI